MWGEGRSMSHWGKSPLEGVEGALEEVVELVEYVGDQVDVGVVVCFFFFFFFTASGLR